MLNDVDELPQGDPEQAWDDLEFQQEKKEIYKFQKVIKIH